MAKKIYFEVPDVVAASAHYVSQRINQPPAKVYAGMLLEYLEHIVLNSELEPLADRIQESDILIESERLGGSVLEV